MGHQQEDRQGTPWRQGRAWLRRYRWWVVGICAFVCASVIVAYQQRKTIWDLLQLLVVPAVLAGAGVWFTRQQNRCQYELAQDKQREDLLAACLDTISDLLRKGELRQMPVGRTQGQGPTIARARALSTLRALDPMRKGELVRFLYEAGLIARSVPVITLANANPTTVITLANADLTEANLSGATLGGANLSGADLSGAKLIGGLPE